MKFEDFVQRLEQEVPEIQWEKEGGKYNDAHYFLAEFFLCRRSDKNGNSLATIPVPSGVARSIDPGILKGDLDLVLENIDENNIGGVSKAFKDWVRDCEDIKRKAAAGGTGEDQIILIHPDHNEYTIPEILKDLKCVVLDSDEGGGIGIMEDKKWNFSDQDLCKLLSENSLGCFTIEPQSADILRDQELDFSPLYKKLVKKYPSSKNITKVFVTGCYD